MNNYYSGIGSRNTPSEILLVMQSIGKYLAASGYILRSGACDGADAAFERGCDEVRGRKAIYIPWDGYNRRRQGHSTRIGVTEESLDLAAQHHPAWDRCSSGAQRLHSRNGHILLGDDLDKQSAFVVCWTPNAKITGGTGQALRLAEVYGVPIFNLANDRALYALDAYTKKEDEIMAASCRHAEAITFA